MYGLKVDITLKQKQKTKNELVIMLLELASQKKARKRSAVISLLRHIVLSLALVTRRNRPLVFARDFVADADSIVYTKAIVLPTTHIVFMCEGNTLL